MGLFRMSDGGGGTRRPDPDPCFYRVLKAVTGNGRTVAKIVYHGSSNYGGRKILVFDGEFTAEELNNRKELDPHFLENKFGPIARFRPGKEGWERALSMLGS